MPILSKEEGFRRFAAAIKQYGSRDKFPKYDPNYPSAQQDPFVVFDIMDQQGWCVMLRYGIDQEEMLRQDIDIIQTGSNADAIENLQKEYKLDAASLHGLIPRLQGNLQTIQQINSEILQCVLDAHKNCTAPAIFYTLNHIVLDGNLAAGNNSRPLSTLSMPTNEGQSLVMLDDTFSSSHSREVIQVVTKSSPVLISAKHNSCPILIGVSDDSNTAVAWHISAGSLKTCSKGERLNFPGNMPSSPMRYIVLGIASSTLQDLLPRQFADAKIISRPTDLFTQDSFVGMTETVGFVRKSSPASEPVSFDVAYFPATDTLILFGATEAGDQQAWYKHNAVNSDSTLKDDWHKVQLGSKKTPFKFWMDFLRVFYRGAEVRDIATVDLLLDKFAAYQEQNEPKASSTRPNPS